MWVCVFVVKSLCAPASECGVAHVHTGLVCPCIFLSFLCFLFAPRPSGESAEGFRSERRSRSGYHEKKVVVQTEAEKELYRI